VPSAVDISVICPWLGQVPHSIREALQQELAHRDRPLLAIEYRPDEDCFFRGEDPFFLVKQIEETRWRAIFTDGKLPELSRLDPFRCLLHFRALTFATREQVEHLFRYVLPQVQIVELPADALAPATGAAVGSATRNLSPAALIARGIPVAEQEEVLRLLRQLETSLGISSAPELLAGRLRSTAVILRNCAVRMHEESLEAEIDAALAAALANEAVAPLCSLISGLLSALNREEAIRVSDITLEDAAPAASQPTKKPSVDDEGTDRQSGGGMRVLKVDQARIDRMMDLIGEMVVAKNSLPYLAERAAASYGVRELSREIKEHYSVIHRITQDMQDAIMEVRMLPVSHVLQRFPRLVRDTARKLNKSVDLVLEGEDTEVDKNIVEALGDPLIHIVRNSLDHGIETPQDRQAAGKPPQGTIRIRASQENGRARIEIRDDGRGIDPAKVKRKAHERGLLSAEALAAISDLDAVQLVFRAGFSTVDAISDLSGRGVGMDVARAAVEQVGGTVQLSSVQGQGTQIVLSLPMTMSSTRAFVVRADEQSFGVPLDIVLETFRAPHTAIFRVKRREVLVRRDRTMPVLRLRELLRLPPAPQRADDEEYAVLIAQLNGGNAAVLVDDFAGIEEVILKQMEGVMAGSRGVASTAILGDGTILLMLDLEELLRCP
jgi:two-component system chemotaxis sensor kinase CheA